MEIKNFTKTNVGNEGRIELHDKLNLTGAEISINTLPAGTSVPFTHSHKQNEEIYLIIGGNGKVVIDEEEISVKEGDAIRISPNAKRQFFASANSEIKFICIQVKENSLQQFTQYDAII